MNKRAVVMCASVLAGSGSAQAFEFRVRFVERVGNMDVPIPDNLLYIQDFTTRNIRLQFGVFDDAAGAAPAGGFVGWNVGTMTVSGAANNSDDRRNPGRLSPFNFASGPNANGNPPLPGGDPFTMLTEIDATLGVQSPIWQCSPIPADPPPAPVVRGLNTFVSVYAFSVLAPAPFANGYTITAGGNLIAAAEWRTVGTPTPPDCGDPDDPSDDVPGNVTYAPVPTAPRSFSAVLSLNIPGPGAAMAFAMGVVMVGRRRR